MKYLKLFAVFGALALVGAGSATLLDVFGTISGTADVERPLEISEINYDSPISGEASGEYVMLESRKDAIDLSNWNLSVLGSGEDIINATRTVERSRIALVDNVTVVRNTSTELNNADIETVEVGSMSGGLSNADGSGDSGDTLTLNYISEGNVEIHRSNYSGSNCGGEESYFENSDPVCKGSTLEISGGGN